MGRSDWPIGRRGCESHITRGHLPKSDFLNFSSWRGVSQCRVALGLGTWYHLGQTPSCDYVSRVHQAVQVPRRLLNLLPHVVVAVKVEHVSNEVERILVVLDLGVEAREVEAVRQVLLVDLAKVFVAAGRYKLRVSVSNVLSNRRCA